MLPLLLRVGVLILAGVFGFAIDVRILAKSGISVPALYGVSDPGPLGLASNLTSEGLVLLSVWAAGLVTYALQAHVFQSSPNIVLWATFLGSLAILLRNQRFRRVVFRVFRGGLDPDHRLGDILFADALVSYASVFVDVALAASMSWSSRHPRDVDRTYVGPFVLLAGSIPTGIRVKQCFLDFRRSGDYQHLANLLKYVVGNVPTSIRVQMLNNPGLSRYLPWATAISSIYGLYWDIRFDWKLGDGRQSRLYSSNAYLGAAVFDAVTRFTWVLSTAAETRVFALQIVEVVRRLVWVVFRVESEPQPRDIELPTLEHNK